ncbi:M42 glutamyl aminopeptidase [compost metagenome]
MLAALKAVVESGLEPQIDCHPLFTITEETGSGAAGALPWDVSEFVGIDIAPVAPGQHSSEHAVSVAMQDSRQRTRLPPWLKVNRPASASSTCTSMPRR